jgi:hypothetical protein
MNIKQNAQQYCSNFLLPCEYLGMLSLGDAPTDEWPQIHEEEHGWLHTELNYVSGQSQLSQAANAMVDAVVLLSPIKKGQLVCFISIHIKTFFKQNVIATYTNGTTSA